jgi:anti-sigma B factor antagonist
MSNLTIGQRQVDGITIIDLDGKVALGETNRQLHEALRSLVMAGTNRIVLNLKNVTTIDSSGLGEIVAGYSTLKSNGGSLVIVNMPERVTDLMTITKLYTVFDIFENENDAVAALQNDGKSSTPLDNGFPSKSKAGTSIH